MSSIAASSSAPRGGADLLTFGFGAAAAMWAAGYFLRLPGAVVPAPVLLAVVLTIALACGFLAGRWTRRGWRAGLGAGLIAGGLNLLIVLSLVSGSNRPNEVVPSALGWIPGSILLTMGLMTLGAALGARRARPLPGDAWTAHFAAVTAGATLVLIMVGGNVTGHDAGLAVPDWPNSFEYNMFMYPLAKMTGGIYFEHSHRLFGALVGLTTLVLAAHIALTERRGWVRGLAGAALVVVCVQGVLGGLRVTGRPTLSVNPADLQPNIALAMVHGVLAQVFFCMLVTLRLALGRAWREAQPATTPAAELDRGVLLALLALTLVQSTLGALVRHIDWGVHLHISLAIAVLAVAGVAGFRAAAAYPDDRLRSRLGTWLLIVTGVQLALGLIALVLTRFAPPGSVGLSVQVAVTTAHQTLGAVFFASVVGLAAWHNRRTVPLRRGFPLQPSLG